MASEDDKLSQKVNDEQVSEMGQEGNVHKDIHPIPAPRSQKSTPFSPQRKSPSLEKSGSKGSLDEPHQNTPEHRESSPPKFIPEGESDSQVHTNTITESRSQQKPLSRSGSVSSTGTYNVENPKKSTSSSKSGREITPRSHGEDLRILNPEGSSSEGSSTDSSTGTYNVENSKISKNVSGTSKTDVPKSLKSSKSKSVNSDVSSGSSERKPKHRASPSTSNKKSVQSKPSTEDMEKLTPENPEEGPSTSHSNTGAAPPTPQHSVTITNFLLTLLMCIVTGIVI